MWRKESITCTTTSSLTLTSTETRAKSDVSLRPSGVVIKSELPAKICNPKTHKVTAAKICHLPTYNIPKPPVGYGFVFHNKTHTSSEPQPLYIDYITSGRPCWMTTARHVYEMRSPFCLYIYKKRALFNAGCGLDMLYTQRLLYIHKFRVTSGSFTGIQIFY